MDLALIRSPSRRPIAPDSSRGPELAGCVELARRFRERDVRGCYRSGAPRICDESGGREHVSLVGGAASLALVLAILPTHGLEAAEWSLCALPPIPPPPAEGLRSTSIEADSARLREDGVSVAEGNVVLRTPDRTITANRMDYDAGAGRAEAAGDVTVRERKVYIRGSRLQAELGTGQTVLEDATFVHPDSGGRGSAERIENTPRATVLTSGTFTRCEPGSKAWQLEASSLELDRESGVGTARNARLDVLGVPILFLPWLSFPLGDERKTGFLVPSFRRTNNAGTSLTLPYYLNLAPNLDATLRARLTSRRGEVLGGRLRYLTERGTGILEADAVPEDRLTGEARSLVSYRHRHAISPGLDARLQYSRASDIDYLRDLGAGSVALETDHLRRFAEVVYEVPPLRLESRIEDFQSLREPDVRRDPYRLAPGMFVESRLPERNRRLNLAFEGEHARFEHRSDALALGERVHFRPSVSLPLRSSAGYLIPRASLRYTAYDLDNVRANVATTPSRTVPSFSLDAGLHFERESLVGNRRITQTIEPRLYYLWVAHRDQDHLPLFDAGRLTFGYDQMFRENRFSGIDRIGDANRLTLAVDTRLLDGGRDLLEARVGRVQHLGDRRVRLCTTADPGSDVYACPPANTVEDAWGSAWVAALKARPHRSILVGGVLEQDGRRFRNRRISIDLRYQPTPERIINLGYRRLPIETESAALVQEARGESDEMVSLSVHHDLGRQLRVLGSASYALRTDTFTEVYIGLAYDSCCFGVRILGQRNLRPRNGVSGQSRAAEHENSILLEIELKGLTGRDRGYRQWWTRPIPGYRNRF